MLLWEETASPIKFVIASEWALNRVGFALGRTDFVMKASELIFSYWKCHGELCAFSDLGFNRYCAV